jgi:hypothetical protein
MIIIKDIDNKNIEIGHIVAVRYVWNSHVGEVKERGLCATGDKRHAFFSPHPYKKEYTYQILGHVYYKHPDFNKDVYKWYNKNKGKCPIKIRVYENIKKPYNKNKAA